MRRTRFADESPPKSLEHAIGLDENLPAAMRRIRIIRRVRAIFGEPHGVRHLDGHGHDLHLDAK